MTAQIVLLVALVGASVAAILAKDLLKSAVALAVASLLLGLIFFQMGPSRTRVGMIIFSNSSGVDASP